MVDLAMLDNAFHHIMRSFIETGRAPHYAELAAFMGISVNAGRQLFRDLEATGYSFFLHPETDQIVSVAPFNNLPTQYRISIDGDQRWFAQWGFEALAVRWLFPGKTIRMDAPCLDCGKPMAITMRDEDVLAVEPDTIVGYSIAPIGVHGPGRAYRWANMNLFRSEEHARNWSEFKPYYLEMLKPLSYWFERFSSEMMRNRGREDFISWYMGWRLARAANISSR